MSKTFAEYSAAVRRHVQHTWLIFSAVLWPASKSTSQPASPVEWNLKTTPSHSDLRRSPARRLSFSRFFKTRATAATNRDVVTPLSKHIATISTRPTIHGKKKTIAYKILLTSYHNDGRGIRTANLITKRHAFGRFCREYLKATGWPRNANWKTPIIYDRSQANATWTYTVAHENPLSWIDSPAAGEFKLKFTALRNRFFRGD